MHADQEMLIDTEVDGWLTAQEVPSEPQREQPAIPWWFVGLVALVLWGPLAGAAFRPYRHPD